MRTLLLPFLFILTLASPASAQSAFPGKKGNPEVRVAEPVSLPAVTVTKPAASGPLASVRAPGKDAATATGTAFRSGDSFELQMSGMPAEDSMTYQKMFTIGGDGFVNIPYAGQIRASGLTQSALERAIERKLIDEKIFRWPTATINVPTTTRYVTIGGAVRAPTRMAWSADLTITSAISACGGPNEFASDKINLIRTGTVTQYRLKALKKTPGNDPPLQPGDQVELL